jgi:hypothetical protein
VRHDRFLLILNDSDLMVQQLAARLERTIGVIYRPETERQSHYFGARLVEQFDAVLHFDKTRAGQAARINGRVGNRRASGDVPVRGVTSTAVPVNDAAAARTSGRGSMP